MPRWYAFIASPLLVSPDSAQEVIAPPAQSCSSSLYLHAHPDRLAPALFSATARAQAYPEALSPSFPLHLPREDDDSFRRHVDVATDRIEVGAVK